MTNQSTTTEPTLEDLAIQAATFLESFAGLESDRIRGQQIAFALRSRVSASVAPAGENSAAFIAYDRAIEDAKAAIRGEKVDDPYAAAIFINAIARKCSPHVYVNRLAPASTVAPQQSEQCVLCNHPMTVDESGYCTTMVPFTREDDRNDSAKCGCNCASSSEYAATTPPSTEVETDK